MFETLIDNDLKTLHQYVCSNSLCIPLDFE